MLIVITIFEISVRLLNDPIGPTTGPNPGPILPRAVIEPDKPITTSFSAIVIIIAPIANTIK